MAQYIALDETSFTQQKNAYTNDLMIVLKHPYDDFTKWKYNGI